MAASDNRAIEVGTSANAVVLLVGSIAALAGGLAGFRWGGTLPALLGLLSGVALGVLAHAIARVVIGSRRLREQRAPDVRALPPDQALQVLGAMLAATGSSNGAAKPLLDGGVLGELARIRKQLDADDPEGALASLELLATTHPRSPALAAERARVLRRLGRIPDSLAASRRAIELALHGGMNRLAVQVLGELGELEPQLELAATSWARLAQVLAASGNADAAARAEARTQAASAPASDSGADVAAGAAARSPIA